MIFKTFNNDIDKISAKWGIFGKSFYDFVEASRNRKIAIDDLFTINGMSLKDAKKQAGSFWSYLYPKREDIQKQLIDVDSVLPKIDEGEANKILSTIKSIENGTNAEIKSFQDLYDTGTKQNQWIAQYAQETQGQIRSTEGVIKANQQARQSAIAHNEALKQQTLGAKAASVAMNLLSTAANMLVMYGISKLITAWDDYKEKLRETAQESAELAQESLNHVTSLNDLKRKLDDGTTSAEELTTAFREQLREMGYTESQIDNLISKYGNLAGAMDEATRKALENAKTDAYADAASSGKALEVDSVGGLTTDILITDYGTGVEELDKQIEEILSKVATKTAEHGSAWITKDNSAEGLYAYYNALKEVSRLIQETASETENQKLINQGNFFVETTYGEVTEAIEKLKESAELYGDALGRIHNADAQIEVSDYLKTNDISTKEEFDSYIQSIKDSTEYSEGYRNVLLQVANDALPQFSQAVKEVKEELSDIPETTPKWSFTETIQQMETAKEKLSNLDEAYAKLFDDDVNTNISTEDFNSILDAFSDIEGLDIEKHLKAIDDAGTDVSKVKSAMEGLIGDYLIYGDILNNVTEENKDLIVTMLTEIGVINAEEIATAALNGELSNLSIEKEFLSAVTTALTENTLGEIDALIQEMNVSDGAKQVLAQLALEKLNVNNTVIDTSADIANIIALAETAKASAYALWELENAKNAIQQFEEYGSWENARKALSGQKGAYEEFAYQYRMAQKRMEQIENGTYDFGYEKVDPSLYMPEIQRPNIQVGYDPSKRPDSATSKAIDSANKSATDSAKKSTEEMKDTFEELVDFFERRTNVLNDALDLLKANLENVNGSFAKNKLIDSQIGINAEKINNYTDAMAMYTQKANEALSKLPADIAEKVKNGAVDLTTFVGEGNEDVVEAIDDYQNWADKVADCKQELAELKQELENLELEKFNNIMDDFQNQFDIRENSKELIDKQIDLFKEAGELIGISFYNSKIDQSEKQLKILEQEKAKLVEQMNSALASGRVKLCPAV